MYKTQHSWGVHSTCSVDYKVENKLLTILACERAFILCNFILFFSEVGRSHPKSILVKLMTMSSDNKN